MKRIAIGALATAVVLALSVTGTGIAQQGAPAERRAAAAPMPSFMAGSWSFTQGELWGDEYWTPSRGGIMIGSARIGRGEQLLSWESTRIAYDENGILAYYAMPNGGTAVKFGMTSYSATEIVFSNPGNQYPQIIRYWREGALLHAAISQSDGSNAVQFNYRPIAAPQP